MEFPNSKHIWDWNENQQTNFQEIYIDIKQVHTNVQVALTGCLA